MAKKPMQPVRHPWDRWFRHKQFTLVKGKHYTCRPDTMAVQVRTAAGARNRSVSIAIGNDGTLLVTVKRKPRRAK